MADARSQRAPMCKDHSKILAVAKCASCSRALCNTCFVFTMGGRPACARCAYETATRPQRRFALAVFFVTFAGGLGFWATRRYGLWPEQASSLVFGGVVAFVVGGLIAATARSGSRKEVVRREDDEEPVSAPGAMDGSAHPYRASARRVMMAVSPRVSGKVTALVVVVSLFAAAVLVPASVRLPRWIEAEMVLGLWWVVLAVTLVVLLYRGFRLKDDLVYFVPWDRPAPPGKDDGSKSPRSAGQKDLSLGSKPGGCVGDGCSGIGGDGCSSIDGEGAIVVVVVVVALGTALCAAWVMVEIAMPLLFFLMYSVLMRAIRRAASDRRGCEGNLVKSLGSAVLWATIYILPIAALAWALHEARG
jgi:hypothetical protein